MTTRRAAADRELPALRKKSGLDAILQVEGLAAAVAHELKLVVHLDNASLRAGNIEGARVYKNVLLVCRLWRKAFTLAVAQLRWDRIMILQGRWDKHFYHSLVYMLPGSHLGRPAAMGREDARDRRRSSSRVGKMPPQGSLEVTSSSAWNAPIDHYRTKGERAECGLTGCMIPPRPLLRGDGVGPLTVRNRIVLDKHPRTVNLFAGAGSEGEQGRTLGWYERSASNQWLACATDGVRRPPREPTTATRPSLPKGAQVKRHVNGEPWSECLVKYAHLDGPDHVAACLEQQLTLAVGPRPTHSSCGAAGAKSRKLS